MENQFARIENEYARLRADFDAGRLTAEEFDSRLRELTIRDPSGKYWMIGADSGQWYYYNGAEWVQAQDETVHPSPPRARGAFQRARGRNTSGGWVSDENSGALISQPNETKTGGRNHNLAYAFLLLGLLAGLICIGSVALLVLQRRSGPLIVSSTPLPPAPATASADAIATRIQSAKSPLPPPQRVTVTAAPAGDTGAATRIIPTITPILVTAVPSPLDNGQTPQSTPPQNPTTVVEPGAPPGVYVTGIRIVPVAPKRQEPITYFVSFVNTSGHAQPFRWLVIVQNPNKVGRNRDFGESPATNITIPPGASQVQVTYVTVTNTGACIALQAYPGWKQEDNARMFFPDVTGYPAHANFTVCP